MQHQKWLQVTIQIFAIVALNLHNGEAAKILGFFAGPGHSHIMIHASLMNALAKRGHEITTVSTAPLPNDFEDKIRKILIPTDSEDYDQQMAVMIKNAETKGMDWSHSITFIRNMTQLFEAMLVHPEFVAIKNEHFDLVVIEWFMNDFHIGLAPHFNAPAVITTAGKASAILRNYVGVPNGVAYKPSPFLSYKGVMTFRQRLNNFLIVSGEVLLAHVMDYFWHEPHYAKHFPGPKYPSFYEARKNISLVLVNQHFSQGLMEAYLPTMVEIGGSHIKSEAEPLPTDIQEWLDGATDGAIFFSLGSNVKTLHLSATKRDAILRSLGRRKQRVLFKWEDEQLEGKPDNVMTGKWLPQSDILAHPNTVLFISHCGLGSVNEARFHGVPILGIPIFADQPSNMAAIEKDGWAVGCPLNEITEERFSLALHEILDNKTYYNEVKRISNLFRDRQQHPLDRAVYWVEYVIRHKGAKHMQSPAVHLNWFQLHSLDVIGFIVLCIYVIVKVVKIFVCAVVRRCRAKVKRE